MEAGVSIIICSFNGAERLPETIRHLATQSVPAHIAWEILVIDNASTDATALMAKTEWEKYQVTGVNFRVLQEDEPGKSFAWETGLKAARYEYLLTCDDDNHLSPHYVATSYNIMHGDDTIGVLGGCGIILPEEPVWNGLTTYRSSYIAGTQHWAPTQHWVYGAGSTCRRTVLLRLFEMGWQQITGGRTNVKLICGEDVELCFIYYLQGYKICADDRLTFDHFIPLKRQSFAFLLNLEYWISYSYVLMNNYLMQIESDQRSVKKKLNSWLIFNLKVLIRLLGQIIKQTILKREQITQAQRLALQSRLGAIASLIQNRKKIIQHAAMLKRILEGQAN